MREEQQSSGPDGILQLLSIDVAISTRGRVMVGLAWPDGRVPEPDEVAPQLAIAAVRQALDQFGSAPIQFRARSVEEISTETVLAWFERCLNRSPKYARAQWALALRTLRDAMEANDPNL